MVGLIFVSFPLHTHTHSVTCTHSHTPTHTAELGDYDPIKHAQGYVGEFKLVPKQTHDMDDRIAQLHEALAGKSNAEAEYMFLSYCRK